jgi:hypothetical protein
VKATVRDVLKARPTWRRAAVDLGAGARAGVDERKPSGLSEMLKR